MSVILPEASTPPIPVVGNTFAVFRERPFLLFWIGTFISNIGNWTENAAQSWAVTSQTAGNPHQALLVEILQFADFCPVLLLALLAGAISDRVNRKVWLIILQAAACVLGTGLAVAAFMGHATPWVVITFTFLEGIIWALNGPVFLSAIPGLVPRNLLDRAIALNSVQFNMARLTGPMIAALVIGVAGVAGAFAFNAATFLPPADRPGGRDPEHPGATTDDAGVDASRNPRGAEIRVDAPRHATADDHGRGLAGFLTHYLSPQWVLRLMLGTLLVVMTVFVFVREPAIDNLSKRGRAKLSIRGAIWEAISAHSHRPAYPAQVDMRSERDTTEP